MKHRLVYLFLWIYLIFTNSSYGQNSDKPVYNNNSPLFAEQDILPIKLSYSKKEILLKTNDSTYLTSNLSYNAKDGSIKTLEVKLKARGNFRRNYCYFIPLWIKIKKDESKGSTFEGQKKLKLVVPCLKSKKSNDLILLEFLAYKIYEIISPYHFKTRLISIDYGETGIRKPIDHDLLGILIEDDKKLAKSYEGKIIKRHIHPNVQDPLTAVRNAYFQYLIANTDFSIAYQHNEKLFYIDDKIVPIPYDFDMSGLVNASYAVVSVIKNKTLPISQVTDRLYRGFERDEQILHQVRTEFLDNQTQIIDILNQHEALFKDPREFAEAKKFLFSFYNVLNDDKRFEKNIIKKARTTLD